MMFKKIVIGLLLLFAGFKSFSQTSFTVSDQALGNANSLDVIIPLAKASANAGNAVIIWFDAPGLVQLDAYLDDVDIIAGSITFDKKITGATYPMVEQGIQYTGDPNDPTINYCLNIANENSGITIQNLKFIGFNNQSRPALRIDALTNATEVITHCEFENNYYPIYIVHYLKSIEISYNTIEGGEIFSNIALSYGNEITSTNIHHNMLQPGGMNIGINAVLNGGIKIEDNQLSGSNSRIFLASWYTGFQGLDPLVQVDIKRNTFNNITGISLWLNSPLPYWAVESNAFNNVNTGIALTAGNSSATICGINFIEPNPFDNNLKNRYNNFTSVLNTSFITSGYFGMGIKLMGLTLNGRVGNSGFSIVRHSKVKSDPGSPKFPITTTFQNPVSIQYTSPLSGNDFTVNYTINGLSNSNAEFIVDFYTSNSDWDIMEYIGSQAVSGDGSYTAALTLPPGVTLNGNIGTTVTSLGDQPGNTRLGTSRFSVFELCDAPIMTSENTATISSGGTVTIPLTSTIPATYTWITDGNPNTSGIVSGPHNTSTLTETITNLTNTPQTVTYTVTPTSTTGCVGLPQIVTVTVNGGCYSGTMTIQKLITSCGNDFSFKPIFSPSIGPWEDLHPDASLHWDFGDGHTYLQNKTEIIDYDGYYYNSYSQDGQYTTTLTYHDGTGTCPDIEAEVTFDAYAPVFNYSVSSSSVPVGAPVVFNFEAYWPNNGAVPVITIEISDGTYEDVSGLTEYTWYPSAAGQYQAVLSVSYFDFNGIPNQSSCGRGQYFTIMAGCPDCEPIKCKDCVPSFAPVPGQEYVISGWVQQANTTTAYTYDAPNISLEFEDGGTLGPFTAKGEIIDGWQRIDEVFTVPLNSKNISIKLNNTGSDDVFFDDIRIHPVRANLKSFVYDPVTMRLMAELDENNYATFYEYDEDGALIRVKKETERGVKTIKESANSTHKQSQ